MIYDSEPRRSTLTRDRFQIYNVTFGMVGTEMKREDAFQFAKRFIVRNKLESIRVFDAMAKKGKPEVWEVFEDREVVIETKS